MAAIARYCRSAAKSLAGRPAARYSRIFRPAHHPLAAMRTAMYRALVEPRLLSAIQSARWAERRAVPASRPTTRAIEGFIYIRKYSHSSE
jgi:hypothetical protein